MLQAGTLEKEKEKEEEEEEEEKEEEGAVQYLLSIPSPFLGLLFFVDKLGCVVQDVSACSLLIGLPNVVKFNAHFVFVCYDPSCIYFLAQDYEFLHPFCFCVSGAIFKASICISPSQYYKFLLRVFVFM